MGFQILSLLSKVVLILSVGLCVNGAFNILSTLVVDLYPQSPSTATAANNLVRCVVGAGGTGIINIMIQHMGRGVVLHIHRSGLLCRYADATG